VQQVNLRIKTSAPTTPRRPLSVSVEKW
jgi:hypothetical protein